MRADRRISDFFPRSLNSDDFQRGFFSFATVGFFAAFAHAQVDPHFWKKSSSIQTPCKELRTLLKEPKTPLDAKAQEAIEKAAKEVCGLER